MNGYEKQAAVYTMLTLWRNFGNRPVLIDPNGKHWKPLRNAERLGWARWDGQRCWLTRDGVQQLVAHGVQMAEAAD